MSSSADTLFKFEWVFRDSLVVAFFYVTVVSLPLYRSEYLTQRVELDRFSSVEELAREFGS
ncbi:MAG: hypothetical protein HLUCCO16_15670 [Phormidium sp. OSCR]|nr:MAG: hypothetical protein HLUCCO16_15670 [Phormidium sp. OSCR]